MRCRNNEPQSAKLIENGHPSRNRWRKAGARLLSAPMRDGALENIRLLLAISALPVEGKRRPEPAGIVIGPVEQLIS